MSTIHNAGTLDYRDAFGTLARRVPIARVQHSMEFFTGGCDSDYGCGKFVDRCGACPLLGPAGSKDPEDLTRQIWLRKRAALSAVPPGRVRLVAPSRWIARQIQRSSLARDFPVTVIPLGVDTDVFRPRDRWAARELFGVPQDARVVVFVAELMWRRVKGLPVLASALQGLTDFPGATLVTVGSGRPAVDVGIPHIKLPAVRGERLLSFMYSAADVVAVPSLGDNFPQVVLEAMACGVPVVGSDVGGIPEQVQPGVTGLLVPPGDASALRDALFRLLSDPALRAEMSVQARRRAEAEYTLAHYVRRYLDLYEAMLGGGAGKAPLGPAPDLQPGRRRGQTRDVGPRGRGAGAVQTRRR